MEFFTPVVELIRLEENETYGTFGILKVQKKVFCATLELSDEENQINISSIPAQQYTCRRYSSEKYPNTFQVMNVPNRTKILFHAGNTVSDTAGCILLGQYHGILASKHRAVLNSGNTFKRFIDTMNDLEVANFHLTIKEEY